MKLDWFNRENKEEYEYLREDPNKLGPHVDHLQQTHPTDLYGDKTYKGKMTRCICTTTTILTIRNLWLPNQSTHRILLLWQAN